MYETHWGLQQKPFENNMDAAFYYPSDTHQAALLKLRYVVENGRQGAVLTGLPGLGKSMIVRSLFTKLPEKIAPRIHLVYPQMPADQLLAYLAHEFCGERELPDDPNIESSVRHIQAALREHVDREQHTLIVVDEAHLIEDGRTFETLRLLLNFTTDGINPLSLLLVGQPELLPRLHRHSDLEERLTVKCLLRPLDLDGTVAYITFRLQSAGANESVFTDEALETIHVVSHGIPRQINRICDLALLIGFAEEQPRIEATSIEGVAQEMASVVAD